MNLLEIKSDISVLEKNFDLYLSKLLNLRKDYHYHHNREIEIEPSHAQNLTEAMVALKRWKETEGEKTNIFISNLRPEKYSYADYAKEFIYFEEYLVGKILRISELFIQYQELVTGKNEVVVWNSEFNPSRDTRWNGESIDLREKTDRKFFSFGKTELDNAENELGSEKSTCIRHQKLSGQEVKVALKEDISDRLKKITRKVLIRIIDLISGTTDLISIVDNIKHPSRNTAAQKLVELLSKELGYLYKKKSIINEMTRPNFTYEENLYDEYRQSGEYRHVVQEEEHEKQVFNGINGNIGPTPEIIEQEAWKLFAEFEEDIGKVCSNLVEDNWKELKRPYPIMGLIKIGMRESVNRYYHENKDRFKDRKEPLYENGEGENGYFSWQLSCHANCTQQTIRSWLKADLLQGEKVLIWSKIKQRKIPVWIFNSESLSKIRCLQEDKKLNRAHWKKNYVTVNILAKKLDVCRSTIERCVKKGLPFPQPEIDKKAGVRRFPIEAIPEFKSLLDEYIIGFGRKRSRNRSIYSFSQ